MNSRSCVTPNIRPSGTLNTGRAEIFSAQIWAIGIPRYCPIVFFFIKTSMTRFLFAVGEFFSNFGTSITSRRIARGVTVSELKVLSR